MKPLNPEAVIEAVTKVSGVGRAELCGRKRTAHISHARKILCYLLRTRCKMSYDSIAIILENRDHTSIIYLCRECEKIKKESDVYFQVWEEQAEKCNEILLRREGIEDGRETEEPRQVETAVIS